ncbi:hypothetical protein Syun_025412 [Stephania yunnanensis]|uniref:Uncharacterized protein n=1 Tax=Stephania yunnanensis TaxID=152371 RepID=A0AAP0HUV1_9MAGN
MDSVAARHHPPQPRRLLVARTALHGLHVTRVLQSVSSTTSKSCGIVESSTPSAIISNYRLLTAHPPNPGCPDQPRALASVEPNPSLPHIDAPGVAAMAVTMILQNYTS